MYKLNLNVHVLWTHFFLSEIYDGQLKDKVVT